MSAVGLLTVEEHTRRAAAGEHLRVLLDGVDVTRRCFVADDVRAYVGLYLHDATGHTYVTDDDRVAVELLTGHVEILPGEPS